MTICLYKKKNGKDKPENHEAGYLYGEKGKKDLGGRGICTNIKWRTN